MTFEKIQEKNSLTYVVSGKLDVNTSPELQEDLEASISGIEELVFDFSGLEYMSSAGLRVLVFADKKMGPGGSTVITGANDFILEILDTTGLLDFFEIRE